MFTPPALTRVPVELSAVVEQVYRRARDAQACFCCYKTCTAAYEDLFDEGVPIDCLASIDENFPAQEAFAAAV